jgi:hypothetical protein
MGVLREQAERHEQLVSIVNAALTHFDTINLGPDEMDELIEMSKCSFLDYAVAGIFEEWILDRNDMQFIERICMYREYFE